MDELVKQILAGDKEAFREIVHTFNEPFLRIAYRFTLDWEDARDVTQTTFIRAYRSLRRYKQGRSFRAWIFAIHLNNCRSAWRKARRRRELLRPLDEASDTAAPAGAHEVDPAILRAIHGLSSRQCTAILLIELDACSTQEAAAFMGCSESTVRVHLARARANLRHRLRRLGLSPTGDRNE
jgi:RNA polymerase sigma-70 factor (ECF subfamily)